MAFDAYAPYPGGKPEGSPEFKKLTEETMRAEAGPQGGPVAHPPPGVGRRNPEIANRTEGQRHLGNPGGHPPYPSVGPPPTSPPAHHPRPPHSPASDLAFRVPDLARRWAAAFQWLNATPSNCKGESIVAEVGRQNSPMRNLLEVEGVQRPGALVLDNRIPDFVDNYVAIRQIHSVASKTDKVVMEFFNKTTDVVNFYWVEGNGAISPIEAVPPGKSSKYQLPAWNNILIEAPTAIPPKGSGAGVAGVTPIAIVSPGPVLLPQDTDIVNLVIRSVPGPPKRFDVQLHAVKSARSAPPLDIYTQVKIEHFLVNVDASMDPVLWQKVHQCLSEDLAFINKNVPRDALRIIRQVNFWVNTRLTLNGQTREVPQYHHDLHELKRQGNLLEKFRGVEICDVEKYVEYRRWQPLFLLHEMGHAYHDFLDLNLSDVMVVYNNAMAMGLYKAVEGVAELGDSPMEAYAAKNHMEYFAELTEAYFGQCDYFPYTNEQLKNYDRAGWSLLHSMWNFTRKDILRRHYRRTQTDGGIGYTTFEVYAPPGHKPEKRFFNPHTRQSFWNLRRKRPLLEEHKKRPPTGKRSS